MATTLLWLNSGERVSWKYLWINVGVPNHRVGMIFCKRLQYSSINLDNFGFDDCFVAECFVLNKTAFIEARVVDFTGSNLNLDTNPVKLHPFEDYHLIFQPWNNKVYQEAHQVLQWSCLHPGSVHRWYMEIQLRTLYLLLDPGHNEVIRYKTQNLTIVHYDS